jgi:hypothetical protein
MSGLKMRFSHFIRPIFTITAVRRQGEEENVFTEVLQNDGGQFAKL